MCAWQTHKYVYTLTHAQVNSTYTHTDTQSYRHTRDTVYFDISTHPHAYSNTFTQTGQKHCITLLFVIVIADTNE